MIAKNAEILVVGGGGVMGSSTALHLARRGYTNVRIMDMFQLPSANSAGNDMNKLISTQYVDGIWGRLAFETWGAWSDDQLFSPYLHGTGRVDLASADNPTRLASLRKQYERSREIGRADNVEWLDSREAILKRAPYLSHGLIEGWSGLWIRDAGWMAARDALKAIGDELERLGVNSVYGTSGTFDSLLLGPDGRTVTGVRAANGTEWKADLVVIAAGAWSPVLVDLEGQCESKCWQFGHIQLSPEETANLKNMPAMYNNGLGFFFEPSTEGVMKIVNEFEGYTRLSSCKPFGSNSEVTMSVPRSHAIHTTDTIPDEGLKAIQNVVDTCLPAFKDREIFDTALCWCTDSIDGNWLICEHPRYDGLTVATGDSGHTFKMLPIVGSYVVDCIEGTLSSEDKGLWRWRPEVKRGVPYGRDVITPKDLSQVEGWRHDA